MRHYAHGNTHEAAKFSNEDNRLSSMGVARAHSQYDILLSQCRQWVKSQSLSALLGLPAFA